MWGHIQMTLIDGNDDFWIESADVAIPFVAIDTVTDSGLVPLEKPGRFVGGTVSAKDGIGNGLMVALFNGNPISALSYGDLFDTILVRGILRLGPAGTKNARCVVFMRK